MQKGKCGEVEKLPEITQSGKNTFGAMVDGKVWVPKGLPKGLVPNYSVVYDAGHEGGILDFRASRVVKESNIDEYIYMVVTDVDIIGEGFYPFNEKKRNAIFFDLTPIPKNVFIEMILEIFGKGISSLPSWI